MRGRMMCGHLAVWTQAGILVILAGERMEEGTGGQAGGKGAGGTGPGGKGAGGTGLRGILDGGTGANMSSPRTLGRYSIDRVILEGAGPPEREDTGPFFDVSFCPNVTAVTGEVATLNCRVYNRGNRTVSWIRLSDLSLLTVGRYTYTSDLRFEGIHSSHTVDWQLALRHTRLADSGQYECQVSTSPHMAHTVHLTVRDPVTSVLGGPEMFVESSSMINLTCLVAGTAGPPDKVSWHHNGTEVNYKGPRPGVSLIVDKSEEVTTVSLLLQLASPSDSGIYTCRPDNAPTATVTLHVLEGDQTAELSGSSLCLPQLTLLVGLVTGLVREAIR